MNNFNIIFCFIFMNNKILNNSTKDYEIFIYQYSSIIEDRLDKT